MREKIRPTRYRLAAFAAAALASVVTVGMIPGVAHADLPPTVGSPPTTATWDLAGGGSDTTTPVMDAIALIATPGHQGTTNLINSFDATGSGTVNTADPNTTGLNCASQTRPNGSGQGIKALAGTLAGTTVGCFQFARVSRGPSGDPPGYTWIPFAQDIVDFAVTNTSNFPRTLSLLQLQAIYTCNQSIVGPTPGQPNTGYNGFQRNAVLPQSGSGTRIFWESLMGITDSSVGSGPFGSGTLGCIINGVSPTSGQTWEEHTGVLLGDYEIEPYSVAQYEIQAEGLIPDLRGRSVLGDIENAAGTAAWQPQVPNAPSSQTGVAVPSGFEREVYNVVPTSEIGGSTALDQEIDQVFVGPSSDLCSPTAFNGAIQATILQYHLLLDPNNCGSTTLQG
jgi:ABC-type phosphate transport system substrate-binding protein